MLGLPIPATVWIYQYLYPVNKGNEVIQSIPKTTDPAIQHIFILAVTAWLLTVGPRENLFNLDQYMPKPTVEKKKVKK